MSSEILYEQSVVDLQEPQIGNQKPESYSLEDSNQWFQNPNKEISEIGSQGQCDKTITEKSSISLLSEESDHVANDWTLQQNEALFRLYQKWGSRWTKISQEIKGKSQNCVKNRFYGSLRKALRKMNRAVKCLTKKFKKEVKYESITRIIDASEGLFRLQSPLKEQSQQLSQKILSLAQRTEEDMPCSEAEQLIVEINKFNMSTRSYKSKKKIKNQTISKKQLSFSSFSQKKQICPLEKKSSLKSSSRFESLSSGVQISPFSISEFPENTFQGQNNIPKQQKKHRSSFCNDTKIQIEIPNKVLEDMKFFDDDDFIPSNNQQEFDEQLFTEVHSPLECELWI